MGGTPIGRRVTMNDAAAELGVSVEAIRKRVQRGSIESDKGPDGRRYVYLDSDRDGRPRRSREGGTEALVEELRDRVRFVEGQLEAERTASAELRRIVAALTQRIPELEAPASDSETAAQASQDSSASEAREPTEPRSWWRRVFGS
jgi:septal ring factor EnvC (AmiA/AmiB activator)